ncbi:MAG: tol-pal system protein YbgF [Ottowia sp.]|nr:tol-pal system protein YbgF [Ottowia sp.]
MRLRLTPTLSLLLLAMACAVPPLAQAQLFGDDQARQAILDLRKRFDESVHAQNRLVEENTALRRNMLELQRDIESLRSEMARLRGEQERLVRDVEELKEASAAGPPMGSPTEVGNLDTDAGDLSQGNEREQYQRVLEAFRAGEYKKAQAGFADFVKRYPSSKLAPDALFWLGNAQYATRDYKEAIINFRSLVDSRPNHDKAPEALLSIANCEVELGDSKAARQTLQSLQERYPDSEAAKTGEERLRSMS